MSDPIDIEIEHAMALLREAQQDWGGLVVQNPCDSACRFDAGAGPCNAPIEVVTVLSPASNTAGAVVNTLVNCQRHADVMDLAIKAWRSKS